MHEILIFINEIAAGNNRRPLGLLITYRYIGNKSQFAMRRSNDIQSDHTRFFVERLWLRLWHVSESGRVRWTAFCCGAGAHLS